MSIQAIIVILTFVTSMTACFVLASMYINDYDGYRGARVLTILVLTLILAIIVSFATYVTFS